MGAALPTNRRSATRHEVSIACTVVVSAETFESEMQNLSLGGALVSSLGRRLAMGTPLTLRFRVPTGEQPIEVAAQVRWSTADAVGVQFEGLRAREVWSLNKFFEL